MRRTARTTALALLTLAACAYPALTVSRMGDYSGPAARGYDFAGAPINALAAGHIGQFFSTQPMMGPVTLLLRAPFVAIAQSLGAGDLAQYRIGCLVCLLVCAALAWTLLLTAARRGRGVGVQAVALVLLLAGPITIKALEWGHPEELVAALLCVAALLAAQRERSLLAGVALGLALATKQWALLAVLPVLMVCVPARRVTLLATAAGVAGLLIAPMLIAAPSLFVYQNVHAGLVVTALGFANVTPANVWYPYGHTFALVGHGWVNVRYGIPTWIATVSHPVAMVIGLGAPALYWWRSSRRTLDDALLLLGIVFLVRCLLDPLTLSYHHVPLFVALVSWETLQPRRWPVVSVGSAAALYALGRWLVSDYTTFNRAYLVWAVVVLGWLTVRLLGVGARRPTPAASAPRLAGAQAVGG